VAGLEPWLLATILLLPPLAAGVYASCVGSVGGRLVAAQFAGAIGGLILIATTFAFEQSSSIDLALMLCLLTLPASLLFALFAERWI